MREGGYWGAGFGLSQDADISFTGARRQHAQLDLSLGCWKALVTAHDSINTFCATCKRKDWFTPTPRAHIRANRTPSFHMRNSTPHGPQQFSAEAARQLVAMLA